MLVGVLGLCVLATLFWFVPDFVPDESPGEQAKAARTSGIATLRAAVLAGGLGLAAVLTLLFNARTAHTTEQNLQLSRSAQAAARQEAERQAQDRARDINQRTDAARDTADDARERRVTELYATAAEQLGSDKAPVRLAGFYALERLARTTPEQRQTIVNVWCAYLRMPYAPTDRTAPGVDGAVADEEREVRRTAQRLIAAHLRPDEADEYWHEVVELDFSGAALEDLDMSRCRLPATTTLSGATLVGSTSFAEAGFAARARFDGAVFRGAAQFDGATFGGTASFVEARFEDIAWFADVTFEGSARFGRALLARARFSRAVFRSSARFQEARLARSRFDAATFVGDVWFTGTRFGESAQFAGARFGDAPQLDGAVAQEGHHSWPSGWATSSEVDDTGHRRLVSQVDGDV